MRMTYELKLNLCLYFVSTDFSPKTPHTFYNSLQPKIHTTFYKKHFYNLPQATILTTPHKHYLAQHAPTSQSKGDRAGVKNIVVLFTDGYATINDTPPFQGADLLKLDGVEVYVVAVGADVHLEQVGSMASSPQSKFLLRMSPGSNALQVADRLLDRLCGR